MFKNNTTLTRLALEEDNYVYHRFVQKGDKIFLHCHDYFEIIFLATNNQQHHINGEIFELPKHALIFVRPDDYHDLYNETNDNAVIHHIAFSRAIAMQLFSFLGESFSSENLLTAKHAPYTILDSVDTRYLGELFDSYNVIPFDDNATKDIMMRSILVQIFTKFFNPARQTNLTDIPLWLVSTCNAMNRKENFSEGLSCMVALSGKTKEHLCRSMKKYYDVTASDFINDIRLTYIANRLANSDKPIIELCFESGFSNLGWMYTLFKRKYGVSPADFRKKSSY